MLQDVTIATDMEERICTTCNSKFFAKRADAKFCSSTCRSKASRGTKEMSPEDERALEVFLQPFSAPASEKEKKGLGTREEQLAQMEAEQRACSHPEEEFYMMRCLLCGKIGETKPRGGESLRTRGCPKHHGSFTCGCKQKEDA